MKSYGWYYVLTFGDIKEVLYANLIYSSKLVLFQLNGLLGLSSYIFPARSFNCWVFKESLFSFNLFLSRNSWKT